MAKDSKIKWVDNQKKLLSTTVKKVNAKIAKIKKNPNKSDVWDYLPDKISVRDLKKEIYSAKDLRLLTNRYQRFLRPGAENFNEKRGTINWVWNEAVISRRARNLSLKNLREKFQLNPLTGKQGLAQEANIIYNQSDLSKKTHEDLLRLIEVNQQYQTSKGQRDRLNRYRENFKKAIDEQIGYLPESRTIKGHLNKLDERELEYLYYNSTYINIGYVYPVEGEERAHVNAILNELQWYLSKGKSGKTRLQEEMEGI